MAAVGNVLVSRRKSAIVWGIRRQDAQRLRDCKPADGKRCAKQTSPRGGQRVSLESGPRVATSQHYLSRFARGARHRRQADSAAQVDVDAAVLFGELLQELLLEVADRDRVQHDAEDLVVASHFLADLVRLDQLADRGSAIAQEVDGV